MRRKRPSLIRVRAREAEDVVGRDVPLDLRERLAEVVRVEERRAAGIGRERRQRVLLRGELRRTAAPTPWPENAPSPPRLPCRALPPGTTACRPRASTG